MYRKYYSYNDMPRPSHPINLPEKLPDKPCDDKPQSCEREQKHGHGGFLANLSNDDLILIAVLVILFLDGCEDKLLLAAIVFLLLGDS